MNFYWMTIGILGVWRVTHLFVSEDGPFDAILRLRHRLRAGFWGRLLDCFYCLSLWIAAPAAWVLSDGPRSAAMLWPALSAGAILVERLHERLIPSVPQHYTVLEGEK